jgi:hypothetical protein
VLLALAGWFALGRSGSHPPPGEAPPAAAPDTVSLGPDARKLAGVTIEPARTAMRADTLEATGVVGCWARSTQRTLRRPRSLQLRPLA